MWQNCLFLHRIYALLCTSHPWWFWRGFWWFHCLRFFQSCHSPKTLGMSEHTEFCILVWVEFAIAFLHKMFNTGGARAYFQILHWALVHTETHMCMSGLSQPARWILPFSYGHYECTLSAEAAMCGWPQLRDRLRKLPSLAHYRQALGMSLWRHMYWMCCFSGNSVHMPIALH